MDVAIDPRWEEFVETLVREGRYGSASEIVREGLRLVEERERKLTELRAHLDAAIEQGGAFTDEEVAASIDKALAEREAEMRRRA